MVKRERQRFFPIGDRMVGDDYPPLVIAEIGINHEGSLEKALRMVDDAAAAGCECVKLQTHVISDEMIPNTVVPANADESIWDIMSRCALKRDDEIIVKERVERLGMMFLSTPFSRAAVDRLNDIQVQAFKVGSGECNNLPLLRHIASFGKPVILSTGMNDLDSVARSVAIFRQAAVPVALMHCTSVYPTPYRLVRLGAIRRMRDAFPDLVIGLSDHTVDNYACYGAVALGASILERHFTSDRQWDGPDIPISMTPDDLRDLIHGSRAIFEASGSCKEPLPEEAATIRFAFASVVAIRDIRPGEVLSRNNVWVKRPGTGDIPAAQFEEILGRRVRRSISKDEQIAWTDFDPAPPELT
ncbi:MAG TPA: N-acetylneuraminate synthase family protein [bacterium]|nr:N-acetylneuraminate synthase family protein [bacterium]